LSLLFIVSIIIWLAAMVWSFILLRRLRDWRIGLVTVTFGLMALHQATMLWGTKESWTIMFTGSMIELPGLVISILVFIVVVSLGYFISQQAEIAKTLRKSEASLAEAQRIAHLGSWDWDIKNNALRWSDEVYRIFGLEPQQFPTTYEAFLNSVHPDDREIVQKSVDEALYENKPYNVENRIVLPDGSVRVVHAQGAVTFEESGKPIKMVGTVQDITERKQVEERLLIAAKEWRATFDSISDLVSMHDTDYRLVRVNRACAKAFKMEPQELIGKTCYEVFHGLKSPRPDCPHKKTLETEKPATAEFFEPHLGVHIEMSTSPIFNEKGKIVASVHVARDITERKHAEGELARLYKEVKSFNVELEEKVRERTRQLEAAREAAVVANRAKSDFLAGMSHELRTPLNAVIGFSQVLQEQYFGDLNEKQAEYVGDILGSGNHLLSLINDILDLSKIEAGKVELELSGVKIKDLLESSLVMIKEKALVHSISLDIHTTSELEGLEIMADERRLKQVMFNLLSNAAKFTPDGGAITVEGKKKGQELIISVSDTGIGLAPEEQEKVFEEFYQASSTIKNKTPGTGLGLSLTRRIVEMHGGRIWAESEGLDKGSRFTFTLPAKAKGADAAGRGQG